MKKFHECECRSKLESEKELVAEEMKRKTENERLMLQKQVIERDSIIEKLRK